MVQARTALRQAGIIPTRQRVWILSSLRRRTDHPDAEMALIDLRESLPGLSLNTLYRTLHLFADEGLIQQLAVPTRRARFDGCVRPHDHFLCRRCGRIVDVERPADSPIAAPDTLQAVAEVQGVQRIYLGNCRDCAEHNTKTTAQASLGNQQ
jgi:Fe2+ or Zn2+ uptake regulation protein